MQQAGAEPWHRTNRGWVPTENKPGKGEDFFLPAVDFDVCIIEAQALKIREWYCRGANGHFGHETTYDEDGNTRGLNTWALFRIKLTNKYHPGYEWFKLNVFTHWSKATRQTVLVVFDLRPPTSSCIERVPTGESDPLFVVPDEQSYINPYWIYIRILEKVVTLQDAAVWSVRDIVRRTEKERDHDAEQERQASIKSKPAPDYRHLHETARHAIHVSETLALAVKAAGRILAQHDTFKADSGNALPDAAWRKAWQHTNGRLRFFEGMISSLLERSDSNKARLFNEIGLAFNMVSQFDSGISVDISRATQKDSEAMKTVAFLTLLFLPATPSHFGSVMLDVGKPRQAMSLSSGDHATGSRRTWDEANQHNEQAGPNAKRQRIDDADQTSYSGKAPSPRTRLDYKDYTVGWVSALPLEMRAAKAMLDNIHEPLAKSPKDSNTYVFGDMCGHNVVIACLPSGQYGIAKAAIVANNMQWSFPCLAIRLMVGIGGGAPGRVDVRLGDVVVSHPEGPRTGVVQYDFAESAPKRAQSERWAAFLKALKFDQIDNRHSNIKMAHAKTCQWLAKHSDYSNWLKTNEFINHHGILWISGKPGAGKSTIMKFAFARANRKAAKNAAVLSFFFNARGEALEKTTEGMHRSLLLQLLEKLPELQTILDKAHSHVASAHASGSRDVTHLRNLFSTAVSNLGERQVTCFIDALDECAEDEVRQMLDFYEDLGQCAAQNNISFYVCFSSRHYPHMSVQYGLRLTLEDQVGHTQDLQEYVCNKLKTGTKKQSEDITASILEKASGVFMWVVLVVDILNKEFDRGRIFAVQKRLSEIPPGLSELFMNILTRDSDNLDDLLLSVQWILFSKRPLNRREYYFALTAGLEPVSLGEWDPEETPEDSMDRFVLSSSKGLAEMTKSKEPTIQFIHESVRDFLLKDKGLKSF
ncbi:Vegetative incompatibility protein HET-E-1 [Colletotrichum trifolii]|uniref:Vegetative incompatibility protein HET-E-1 n=1 Tax=Colletotrichum trifolii TaxID=5466 RepID=A0A4R8R1B6_COLTR|nr:Vegetative incompatibility protein HET-E-1 [Colletotrichum trifolii]